jgi:AcrR family transcriptional regulator
MVERPDLESSPPRLALGPRERIREALIDVALAIGYRATSLDYQDTSLRLVLDRAGVDQVEFERHFTSLEDCYLQIYLENRADFDRAVFSAFDDAASWREGMRAGAYAAARYIRDNTRGVAFSLLQRFNVDDIAQVYRERQLEEIVDRIDLGRQELDDPDSMTRHVAEAIMGSLYDLMVGELLRGNGPRAEEFVPDLMYVAVRPYLGHRAALEELSIPPPAERRRGGD